MNRNNLRVAAGLLLNLGSIDAQDRLPLASQPAATPPSQYSPYLGRPVFRPELLSGLWEAPTGLSGAVGINLQLTTSSPRELKTLSEATHSWQRMTIGVFQRKGAVVRFGEMNHFPDSYPESNFKFENGRLQLHSASAYAGVPSVDLDLVQGADVWVGRLHRGEFDSVVRLVRPGVVGKFATDPIVGSWSSSARGDIVECLHIAQVTSTEFSGWADWLRRPSLVQFADHPASNAIAFERYGTLLNVARPSGGRLLVVFDPFSGGASYSLVGDLRPDGTLLLGNQQSVLSQLAPGRLETSWKKQLTSSCNNF